jgi:aminoglycoside phosphotransferase (APT) family kinase protein
VSPFTLPDHVDVTSATLNAIADRYSLGPIRPRRLPERGIFNAIFKLNSQVILRVPRKHPRFIQSSRHESIAVPAARKAGVRTPELIAFDDTLELLPVPFTLYERVPGQSLEALDLEPGAGWVVWHELGGDLARAHVGVPSDGAVSQLDDTSAAPDPRDLIERRASDGWFTGLEVCWLGDWLDRLAPAALQPTPLRFLHGDSQGTNVMVRPRPLAYRAVIDWGSTCLGDMALDFAGVPLRAVPFMLAGHREVAPLDADDTAEARIVWRHLQLALWALPKGAVPGRSWAERPLAMLLEVLRFFADPPDERWRGLGPIAPSAPTRLRLVEAGSRRPRR